MRNEQAEEQPTGAVSTARRWGEYLIAILGGNIIYLFIEPELPTILRHRARIDAGLAVDFLICVAAYGLVRLARPLNRARV
jgi:hypothetical protein